ncbi:MAG TPA: hypothetical protein VFN03_07925, partial [Trueperaceae bacterium]|nr:hypothetical protein [Trueperaceae bacterium]
STAEALLYYQVGGMWLPVDQQDTVRDLLRGRSEATALAAHLQRLLLAGGNGLEEPDQALLDAMEAAHTSLLGDPAVHAALARTMLCPFAPWPASKTGTDVRPAAGELSVIIHGGTDSRAGTMLVHNPAGMGIVAMNELRRPAALLAYEVAWEDVDHNVTEVDPPVLIEKIDVPATGNLEFFTALGDIVTGGAPWAPVLSEPLVPTSHEGATLTQYELVLIGPSLTSATEPIWNDPRFTSFHSEWEDIAFDETVELFLEELVLPLVGVYTFGNLAKFTTGRLKAARDGVKAVYDSHLLGLGVYLQAGTPEGYALGVKFVLEELARNKTLRLDMLEMVSEALDLSDRRKISIEAADARLAAQASAATIAFAVETLMVAGDITKIVTDLASAPMVASWQVEVMPARFLIDPPLALISSQSPTARFKVSAVGDPPSGNYRFRWSTSGTHGVVYDFMGSEGLVIDTESAEVMYIPNDTSNIKAGDVDSILLEVFLVDNGVDEIPADARPIGKGQAEVRGQGQEDLCYIECHDDGLCYYICP